MPVFYPVVQLVKVSAYSSIQDTGRYGFRHLGIPTSGPMDTQSAMLCNQLLDNRPNAPLLEIIGPGTEIRLIESTYLVFTGAKADITSDGDRIPKNHPVFCREGQILRIGAFQKGAILYLGISGGFYQKKIANSASPLVAGSHSRLRPGTMLLGQERKTAPRLHSHISAPEISMDVSLSVMEGPEYSWLSDQHKEHLFDQTFTVSTRADRMGFLLSGMSIYRSTKQEMRTSAVMPGVVQCLPDGQLLVLMRDCQTTGGYPRILVLDELSLNQLAQRAPGNLVKFQKK